MGCDMKVSIDAERGVLVVEVPLREAKKSKSGRSLVVASAQGDSGVDLDGERVFISFNAYIRK